MPLIGFGTAAMRGELTRSSVVCALEAGFTHIDTAEAKEWYDQKAVGNALKGFNRDQVFITTKLHPKHLGKHAVKDAVNNMLIELGVQYIDLLLVHFPQCGNWIPGCVVSELHGLLVFVHMSVNVCVCVCECLSVNYRC